MDASEIAKVKLFAGHYKRGEGADQTARHYVDVRIFRPILHDLSWGKMVEFVDFKGSEKGADGKPESRVLKIRSGKDKKDREAIFITLQAGPGAVVGEGAVKPAGQPTTEVNIVLLREQARQIAYDVLEFLTAVRTKLLLQAITQPGGKPQVTIEDMVNALGLPEMGMADGFTPAPKPAAVVNQLDPIKAFAEKRYLNNEMVPAQFMAEYNAYTQETGKPPFNHEALMSRMFR
ncbi:MAG: hypothetical protein KF770_28570 [Anaerolineae bacterium]|nr:hypothetical protein [Anaerolineae bacterium]